MGFDEGAAGDVRGEHVAGKDTGNLPSGVECDVDQKCRIGAQRDFAHFFPDWIAGGHTPSRTQVTNHFVTVIAVNTFRTGDGGQHAFWSAAEAGEEMRFDETS